MNKVPGLLWVMLASVAALVAGGVWDQRREAEVALEDFAEQQSVVARAVAHELSARLQTVRRDGIITAEAEAAGREPPPAVREAYSEVRMRGKSEPPTPSPPSFSAVVLSVPVPDARVVDLVLPRADLVADISSGAGSNLGNGGGYGVDGPSSLFLLRAPGERSFSAADGRIVEDAALSDGGHRQSVVRLERPAAVALGLPERIAFAGLSTVDAGPLGRWGVAVVTSAAHERDREIRGGYRLALLVVLSGCIVATFAFIEARRQRKEMQLSRALEVADVQRRGEERLDAANRAATLGTLALGIAHELSTPLSVITGRANQLLPRVAGDDRAANSVRAILDQTDRIGQVVHGFLGLARGKSPAAERLQPKSIVDRAVALVEHRYEKASVHLSVHAMPGVPHVRGDARLLEHAVVNLLLNACDACERDGHVDVHVDGSAGGFAVITVVDDGHGISREDAEHVMEPFFTTKAPGDGTGLGLPIVREIVKSHRGDFVLEPAAPRGTRAVITIPLAPPEEDAA